MTAGERTDNPGDVKALIDACRRTVLWCGRRLPIRPTRAPSGGRCPPSTPCRSGSLVGGAAASYATTYTGLYYVGIMVANSGGTQPNIVAAAAAVSGLGGTPKLSGNCTGGTGTSQTTPAGVPDDQRRRRYRDRGAMPRLVLRTGRDVPGAELGLGDDPVRRSVLGGQRGVRSGLLHEFPGANVVARVRGRLRGGVDTRRAAGEHEGQQVTGPVEPLVLTGDNTGAPRLLRIRPS